MGLCFFSLSSNMSSNIFDQSREISIMLSLGFRKNMLIRLFIYEALVLVISSSLTGFGIGLFIGNLMMMQQAIL
jgi:ABC-type antimicrobial peptide transport system permease subunit